MTTLTVYRTAPQGVHDAADEQREHGNKAYAPRQRLRRPSPFTGKFWPTAPGYVFAKGKARIAFAKHCRTTLGEVESTDLARLYESRKRASGRPTAKFADGELVGVNIGKWANMVGTVARQTKKGYMVNMPFIGGKICEVFVPEKYLYRAFRPSGVG